MRFFFCPFLGTFFGGFIVGFWYNCFFATAPATSEPRTLDPDHSFAWCLSSPMSRSHTPFAHIAAVVISNLLCISLPPFLCVMYKPVS